MCDDFYSVSDSLFLKSQSNTYVQNVKILNFLFCLLWQDYETLSTIIINILRSHKIPRFLQKTHDIFNFTFVCSLLMQKRVIPVLEITLKMGWGSFVWKNVSRSETSKKFLYKCYEGYEKTWKNFQGPNYGETA